MRARSSSSRVVRRTYHAGTAGREEESLAKGLEAKRYKGEGTGQRVREVLNLDVNGVLLNFAHHLAVGTMYKSLAADRELAGAMLAELRGYPRCAAVIRSHVHSFRHVVNGLRHSATTACCRKQGVFRMRPDIGGLVVSVRPNAEGDDPLDIRAALYPLPEVPGAQLEAS